MKSDAFQTFVRQNKPALRVAGFGDAEIDLLESVADDLQRANRSVASVKLPGGSNTAQDTYAMAKGATAISRLIHAAVAPGAGVGAGTALGGPLGAAIGGLGGVALDSIRRAGFERVDELVADALLHPGRARVLMMKARPGKETAAWQMIARAYALKAARPSVAVSADQLDGDPDNGGSAVRQPLEITVRPKGKQGRIQPPNGGLGGLGGMAAQR
jgi:hypothetical protein